MARPRTVSDEAVLAGAAVAVAAAGPGDVTLAEIGARVGLAPATLLQRFGSKRGLLLALARHGADTLPRQLAAAQHADAPVAALVEVFAGLAEGVRSRKEFANHLAFLLLDLSDPDFQQISRDYANAVERAIADVLAASRAAGELTSSGEGLARAVHAAYNGALVTWGMTGDGHPAEHVRSQLGHLLGLHLADAAPSLRRDTAFP